MRRFCFGSGRGEVLRMVRVNFRACSVSRSVLGRGRASEICRGSKMGGGYISVRVVGERRWRLGKGYKRLSRVRRYEDVGGSWVFFVVLGLSFVRRVLTFIGGVVFDFSVAAWL